MKFRDRTFSISFMMITVLVIFSLAGTSSLLFLSRTYSQSALHTLADDIIKRTVKDSAEHVGILLRPAINAVNVLDMLIPAEAQMPDTASERDIIRYLINALEDMPSVYTVYYANADGEFFLVGKRKRNDSDREKTFFHKKISVINGVREVTETWHGKNGAQETVVLSGDSYDPRVRPWYQKAGFENGAIWTSPYVFYITKLPGITYARPVFHNGHFAGVMAADLEIDTISEFMMGSVFTDNTSVFAVDAQENLVAYSKLFTSGAELKDKLPSIDDINDPVMRVLKDKAFLEESYGGIVNMTVDGRMYKGMINPYSMNGMQVLIGMYTPASDYLAPFNVKFASVILLAVVLLAVVILIGRYISLQLARPFRELIDATESAKDLNFDKKINIITSLSEVTDAQKNFNGMLENLANYKSANELLSETLHNAHIDTLYRLAMAAEHKDQYTYDHLKRVSDISVMIADVIGMSKHDMELIRHASAMHDVGKLGIPDSILMKPGRLTADEFDVIKTHSELGARILERPSSEEMEAARVIAGTHHEKWDGSGYPHNLAGVSIPLFGRIVSVADVMDALLSKRPYKEPYGFDESMQIISCERGRHFDPELTDVVLENRRLIHKLIFGS
jgi:putative two-component system response regulator